MWRTVDLILRIIYLLLAPLFLVISAAIVPITGLVISAGLATIVAMFGASRWRELTKGVPLVGRGLAGMSRLGEFYEVHPPKPLVYYVFYPLLLPVILFLRVPRRELLLYRKLGAVALVVLVAVPAIDYIRHWRPDLPIGLFIASMLVGFIFQLIAIFALIMPIVTTFVTLRARHMTKTTIAVVVVALLSGGVGYIGLRKSHEMSFSRWMRIQARTFYADKDVKACKEAHTEHCENPAMVALIHAVDAAAKSLVNDRSDESTAVGKAHDALEAFYKPDEAAEFRLYAGEGIVCVFVQYGRDPPMWLARDRTTIIHDAAKLPDEARKQMRLTER